MNKLKLTLIGYMYQPDIDKFLQGFDLCDSVTYPHKETINIKTKTKITVAYVDKLVAKFKQLYKKTKIAHDKFNIPFYFIVREYNYNIQNGNSTIQDRGRVLPKKQRRRGGNKRKPSSSWFKL